MFANLNGPATVREPGYALRTILSYVSDILLDQSPWLNHQTACSYPSPWVNSSHYPSPKPENFTNNNIVDFIGIYGSKLLPDVKISVKVNDVANKYLWLEMNRIKGELVPTADVNAFRFKMVEPWEYAVERVVGVNQVITYPVNFTRSGKGTVESFNLTFSEKEVIIYRKNWRFMSRGNNQDGISMSGSIESSLLYIMSLLLLTMVMLN